MGQTSTNKNGSGMAKDRTRYRQALRKGQDYNVEQKWRRAYEAFRAAIREFPTEPAPYAGLGEACVGLKMYDRALDCYKLAARYSKGELAFMKKVADMQERMGRLDDAGRTYMATGELALRRRLLDEAVSNWERAIRLEPNLLGAHRRLAMVFQRQDQTRAAVREYLAIARILEMRGEKQKALQMCRAALRLDPDNADVRTAAELIHYGEKAFAGQAEPEPDKPAPARNEGAAGDAIADAVRQMASVFAADTEAYRQAQEEADDDPLTMAHRLAQEQLAEEIFRDEDDEEVEQGQLSKLERDALIGQAMDFQGRNQLLEAIGCYERAISGGLELPAAQFALGLLYLETDQRDKARQAMARAGGEEAFQEAIRIALG